MATKQLKFKDDAKTKLQEGVAIVEEAVSATLGPKGNNVAIERPWGTPAVVHDGVTVAKEVTPLEDKFQNLGAQLMVEAAQKTNDAAGDGTTTATVLAKALIDESLKNIAAGHNAMMLRRGIDIAVEALTDSLQKMAKPIKTDAETLQVATISAQHEEIGKLISDAIKKIGKDGVVTVEESGSTGISMEYKEGMEFDRGWTSPYFQTNQATGEATIEQPFILITDKRINNMQEFMPFVERFMTHQPKPGPNLVIVADTVDGEPLATLIVNKVKGNINALIIQAPGYGDKRKAQLEDIATLTGGEFISEESGQKLDTVEVAQLGRATKITSTKDSTVIIGGLGAKEDIDSRVDSIKKQLSNPDLGEFDSEKLTERLAKLTTGVAVINVGANTEAEMKELKERAIDAISATKAALDEGIVPGGETAIIKASIVLDSIHDGLVKDGRAEEAVGVTIVKNAVTVPFRKLLANAGLDAGEFLQTIRDKVGVGVDVIDGKVKDMVKSGVIDPVKVTRSALNNAASTAVMVMTTNVLIVDKPEVKPSEPAN